MPVIIVTTHYICSFSPGLDPRLSNKGAEEKPETMLPYNGCPVTSYLQTLKNKHDRYCLQTWPTRSVSSVGRASC